MEWCGSDLLRRSSSRACLQPDRSEHPFQGLSCRSGDAAVKRCFMDYSDVIAAAFVTQPEGTPVPEQGPGKVVRHGVARNICATSW